MLERNERCPCGKKRKYRKCCGRNEHAAPRPSPPRPPTPLRPAPVLVGPPPIEIRRAILRDINRMSVEQQRHIALYGKVNPVIAARHKDYQFVAAGNKVFYAKNGNHSLIFLSATFPQFSRKSGGRLK